MKPLVCDALWTTRPSKAERWLKGFPIIGWAFASALEQARFRPMVRSIECQLRERSDTAGQWGSDPKRREVSTSFRRLIAEEFGWPNDHFVPGDPFGIACWGHRDGMDNVSAVMRIEKEFCFQQPDFEWERLWLHGTLGEFVDQLMANDSNG